MTPDLMQQFFTITQNDTGPLMGGYFVEMQITHHLVKGGLDFSTLTKIPGKELWQRFNKKT